jgi:hypothetical protein
VPGPNYIWSIDGYLKLAPYGIEIYAGIDAYARYIIWIYVGTTARTEVCVLRQYLDTLEERKIQSQIVRSDRGSETVLLAEAHHRLRRSSDLDIPLKDCYFYGTSTENERIENWWGQMSKGQVFKWRVSYIILYIFVRSLLEIGLFLYS